MVNFLADAEVREKYTTFASVLRLSEKEMYYVRKRMEIAGCHRLSLPYESKCTNLHGHNWVVTVYCRAKELNGAGMVIDFKHIKDRIHD